MNRAFYTGRSGLMAYQTGLDISSHNLVNSGTTGYKSTKGEFRQLMANNMDININRELPEDDKIKAGTGVRLQNEDLLFTQGVLHPTGYPLDFAIAGEGLFAVETRGEVQYTRNGTFDVSMENGTAYLVTSDGSHVLDENYERIAIPFEPGTNKLNIDNVPGQLGIFSFDNPFGLIRTDGATFRPSDNSGAAQPANKEQYDLIQGSTENSNVDVAQTMADVMVIQKAYQFSARVVTTAEEVEQVINSLRG